MPNARLLEASSLLELRLQPARLTAEIAAFVDEVWDAKPAKKAQRAKRAPAKRRTAPAKRASR
jgi:hypothetical protein